MMLVGLTGAYNAAHDESRLVWPGAAVMGIGSVGLVGHALALPVLYYHVPAWSGGMAVHTAALMVLVGWAVGRR